MKLLVNIVNTLNQLGHRWTGIGRFPGLEEDYGPERVLSEQELVQMGRALGIEVVV